MARKALLGNVTDNDLRLLRVFRAVVACGGFAAAELELNINRSPPFPAISKTWKSAWVSPSAGAAARFRPDQ